MVVLNKIYTRTGDAGLTALGTGERVPKHALRIAAYGTVDETNAAIGMARIHLAASTPTSTPCWCASRTISSISAPTSRVPERGETPAPRAPARQRCPGQAPRGRDRCA